MEKQIKTELWEKVLERTERFYNRFNIWSERQNYPEFKTLDQLSQNAWINAILGKDKKDEKEPKSEKPKRAKPKKDRTYNVVQRG